MLQDQFRVSYLNCLDGKRRVLVGQISRETAADVVSRFGDLDSYNYLNSLKIEPDDGVPDGALIE